MRSTWYATYVCNVKSISMTVEKWSVQSVHFRVIKRETRWSRGQGRAGQTCSTMLNWARGSLRSALLHHKCAFYNPYQFLPFPQFLQGFTHVLSRKCRKWHLRALVGSFSLKSRMVGRLDNSGTGDLPMYLFVLGIFILLLLLVVCSHCWGRKASMLGPQGLTRATRPNYLQHFFERKCWFWDKFFGHSRGNSWHFLVIYSCPWYILGMQCIGEVQTWIFPAIKESESC